MNKINLTYNKILVFLFFYKTAFCVIGEFFLRHIMKRGDVPFYMYAEPSALFREYGISLFSDASAISQLIIGFVFTLLKSEFMTHLVLTWLSFYGIKVFLDSIPDKNDRYFKILLGIFFLPGFNVWSSVAGKETIIIFAMGIICAQIIRYFNNEKIKLNMLFFTALYLVFVIKMQYIPAVLQIFLYIFIRKNIKISVKSDLILLAAVFAVNILLIYLMKDIFSDYSLSLHKYYRSSSRSTRPRFFVEQYDFFRKMPGLMPMAMWGPTLAESKISKMHLFSFAESAALFLMLSYFLIDSVCTFFRNLKKYYQWLFLFIISTGWLFIAQYIQGVMNAGAAVRYRTNLVLIFSALCYSASIIKKKCRTDDLK